MEFPEALARAWREVEESAVPSELREAALIAGLAHYLGSSHRPEGSRSAEIGPSARNIASVARMAPTGDAASRLVSETGIERDVVDELIYFDAEDVPSLNGGARRLGRNNAERSRAVALILCSARHFANDELEVPLDPIRDACKQLGIYDQNNFASYMSDVPGFVLAGPRSNRVLRAKSDAAQRFRQKAQEIVGGRDS